MNVNKIDPKGGYEKNRKHIPWNFQRSTTFFPLSPYVEVSTLFLLKKNSFFNKHNINFQKILSASS